MSCWTAVIISFQLQLFCGQQVQTKSIAFHGFLAESIFSIKKGLPDTVLVVPPCLTSAQWRGKPTLQKQKKQLRGIKRKRNSEGERDVFEANEYQAAVLKSIVFPFCRAPC